MPLHVRIASSYSLVRVFCRMNNELSLLGLPCVQTLYLAKHHNLVFLQLFPKTVAVIHYSTGRTIEHLPRANISLPRVGI